MGVFCGPCNRQHRPATSRVRLLKVVAEMLDWLRRVPLILNHEAMKDVEAGL